MFKKRQRLTKKDLEKLYKKGQILKESFLLLRFQPNRSSIWRFAVITPKKIVREATVRNRLRRKTYQILKEITPSLVDNAYDVSLSYKSFTEDNQIRPVIITSFKKAKLISPEFE